MKKTLLFSSILVFLIACGGVKKTQEAINTGNYVNAMDKALKNLANNKTRKGNQPYIVLLEEAFAKHTERELNQIAFWEKDGNPANYEGIFNAYSNLRTIQERIRPLLPLYINEEQREAQFSFNDYENDFLDAKDQLSEHLYDNAEDLLTNALNKQDYRKAYADFTYLEQINPGFEDTRQKIEEAHAKGLDYVKVRVINATQQIIPTRLEDDLLNFNTYGLNDLWTAYHATPVKDVKYDYSMEVAFLAIDISPEQINEKEIIKEKLIKDGYKYATDNSGNVVRDSLGNKIKVDRFKKVTCDYYRFTQYKAAQVTGNVNYIDLNTKQRINTYPLSSEFIFEHVYADFDGDKRALDNDLIATLQLEALPFPTNEQMVYDAGEDLKARLKRIISRHKFN